MKIDLVYTWVNGNDKDWLKEKEYWQEKLGVSTFREANNCRFIDNQELRFSLRSAEMNAPWINQIFIVTNGQVPDWLDTNHPKIKIVTHDEIMPKDALPTFNSEAIETCIHKIPGLSEYFLYANDDCFINRPVEPDYFFGKDGKPIIRLCPVKWSKEVLQKNLYCNNVTFMQQLIYRKFGKRYDYESAHNIAAYRKSYFEQCEAEFSDEVHKTTCAKFRTANSFQRTIVDYYTLANDLGILKEVECYDKSCNGSTTETLVVQISAFRTMMNLINKHEPYLLCLNDNEAVHPDNRPKVKKILQKLYPEKQKWEKETDFQITPAFAGKDAIAIVFAPDNNYTPYFAVALQSLICNSKPEEFYDILVFEDDITDRNKKLLLSMIPENFSLRFYPIGTVIYENLGNINFKVREYWSISTYYRLLIPLVMQQYSRVMYADADVCFDRPIADFYYTKCEKYELIAIKDTAAPIIETLEQRYYELTHYCGIQKPQNYFNAGIVIFNLAHISLTNYINSLQSALKIPVLTFQDQDILNTIFQEKTKLVSCQWNCQYHMPIFRANMITTYPPEYREDYLNALENPAIIHYTSSRKPWYSPKEILAEVFWKYARMTPFYEEILFKNIKGATISLSQYKYLFNRRKIYWNYYRCKLLVNFTFGKLRKHYKEKKHKLKAQVKEIRKFMKS